MAARTGKIDHPTRDPAGHSDGYPAGPADGQPVAEHLATRSTLGRLMMAAIRFYQRTISLTLPPSCRFYPSCSEYTLQAIAKYGPLQGGWLGVKRILRCQPLSPGGYDPVP